MKYGLILTSFFITLFSSLYGQSQDSVQYHNDTSVLVSESVIEQKYKPFSTNILKLSPVLTGGFQGGAVFYETGLGSPGLSGNAGLRYVTGKNSSVRESIRLELQLRYWLSEFIHGAFVSADGMVYDNGNIGAGILLGAETNLGRHFIFDIFAGIQITTPSENIDQDTYLRYGLGVGYIWRSYQ